MNELKIMGLDRYEVNARLRPALFSVLPVLALIAAWLPSVWTALGALTGLLVACGVTLIMSRIARWQGRKVEVRLKARIGTLSTAAALRHADNRIDPVTKARYHVSLQGAGLPLPSLEEEVNDPEAADHSYRGCVTWLLEQTRDKKRFELLADENVDYGFRRNLLGLKPFAVPVLLICMVANGAAGYALWQGFDANFWKSAAIGAALFASLGIWLWMINEAFVIDASESYARRLLACCDHLQALEVGRELLDKAFNGSAAPASNLDRKRRRPITLA